MPFSVPAPKGGVAPCGHDHANLTTLLKSNKWVGPCLNCCMAFKTPNVP